MTKNLRFFRLVLFIVAVNTFNSNAQTIDFEYSPKNAEPKETVQQITKGQDLYSFEFNVENIDETIEIIWQIPAINMHNYWTTSGGGFIKPNWMSRVVQSNSTSNAPVISLFDNNNMNKYAFAVSDALNQITFHTGVIEETAMIINKVIIDKKATDNLKTYKIDILVDRRNIPYWESLHDVSKWWAGFENYKPMAVPEVAKLPMYSTWYNFHQQLDVQEIIEECKIAKTFGCKSVIVDDGWQTNDNNRGYMYAGDWEPERIPDMKSFVDNIHALDMKFILWYSVPFVGEKTKAYEKFKGKYLTKDVLDPRYPEVRDHLINVYIKAMKDWGLDGFKLDFVDKFRYYKDTPAFNDKMDYANVYEASDKLMSDISKELIARNKDILIEFRQSYIGPLMRKYGNMFRAADCPYSVNANRNRITNIRLLADNTAAHSDMIMWHPDEPVEIAALQVLNVMFSVPQISIKLNNYPKEHVGMLNFWVSFWVKNRDALLDGEFEAYYPNFNYPVLIGKSESSFIAGIYAPNMIVPINDAKKNLYFMNATGVDELFLKYNSHPKKYNFSIVDCKGNVLEQGETELNGLMNFKVPQAGLLQLTRL